MIISLNPGRRLTQKVGYMNDMQKTVEAKVAAKELAAEREKQPLWQFLAWQKGVCPNCASENIKMLFWQEVLGAHVRKCRNCGSRSRPTYPVGL